MSLNWSNYISLAGFSHGPTAATIRLLNALTERSPWWSGWTRTRITTCAAYPLMDQITLPSSSY